MSQTKYTNEKFCRENVKINLPKNSVETSECPPVNLGSKAELKVCKALYDY